MPHISPSLRSPSGALAGIGFKLASVCVFLAMSTFVRSAHGIPAGQLVFFRSFFALLPIMVFIAMRGDLGAVFHTKRPLGHLWRGLIGAAGMGFGFYGLTLLPLAESIVLGYSTPLLIVVLSALLLKEQVRLYRWTAVLVGLVGVLVIMWPKLGLISAGDLSAGTTIGALAILISSAISAGAMLMVRTLVQTERSATIVIYFSIISSIVALFSLPFGWVWPNPQQAALLVGAGIAGGIGQILLTESYRHAEMSVIAPFEYSSLLLGVIIGYLVFGDVLSLETIAGGAIVMAAGIFIIIREHRLGLERKKAKAVMPPQG
jgi:drug/metabolite transporter (DMT)-like permease